jgi:RNA polymerase-associated protein
MYNRLIKTNMGVTAMSAFKTLNIFTNADCIKSHILRFMAEVKEVEYQVIDFQSNPKVAALAGVVSAPAICDRDLTNHDLDIIVEYIEERHPAPALLPNNAVTRATYRNQVRAFHRDIFPLLDAAVAGCEDSRKALSDSLRDMNALTQGREYFASETMTLMDCALIPWLYAAKKAGLSLKAYPYLAAYAERMFELEAFTRSLGLGAKKESEEAA